MEKSGVSKTQRNRDKFRANTCKYELNGSVEGSQLCWAEFQISHFKLNSELQPTLFSFAFGPRWENGLLAFLTWIQDICISVFFLQIVNTDLTD